MIVSALVLVFEQWKHIWRPTLWTRSCNFPIVVWVLDIVAGIISIIILHHTRVVYTIVTAGSADTAVGFLHYDGQNEPMVDTVCLSNRLNAIVDSADLGTGVVGHSILLAGDEHVRLSVVEPI